VLLWPSRANPQLKSGSPSKRHCRDTSRLVCHKKRDIPVAAIGLVFELTGDK